uniref:Uncharacterized protein n=1 Tax=Heliothis virescens TaxID=7102 RepID=A0A2A4JGA4_HELVI
MFVLCIGTSLQQTTVNVTTLSSAKLVYFDKIADMQIRQDDWKMVVYYNMTTYWRSLQNIADYVTHLNSLTKKEPTLISIASQLEHEIKEIQHYNDVLQSEHGRRKKRGLINGIGNAANYLFGVLDEDFAKKYDRDINLIQTNENHLLTLYKEQTSIVEGEYNILKRNEDIMNKQFTLINKRIQEANEHIRLDSNLLNVMSTALAANLIISNIRRTQQLLLDLVTDVKGGRVDAHLLKPDQLQEQLNIISGQLPSDLFDIHRLSTRT